MEPPVARVVTPRLVYGTGRVTSGGIILLDVLTKESWKPVCTVKSVLEDILMSLVENGARIDFKSTAEGYSLSESEASVSRAKLIDSSILPTENNMKREFVVFRSERDDIQKGNKILLPPSILHMLSDNLETPLVFEIRAGSGLRSYCGVLEFVAEEGTACVPNWMMKNLFIEDGDSVQIRNVMLPIGEFVKFQPHSSELIEVNDNDKSKVVAMLEWILPRYATLTLGETIEIPHNGKIYLMNILELEPNNAVTLISDPYLDLKIEFTQALDFVEEKEVEKPESGNTIVNDNLRESSSVICRTCQRAIPVQSSVLHENMCSKRNKLCEICNAVVRKENFDDHIETEHCEVLCECGENVEKYRLQFHKSELCELRMTSCSNCQYQCSYLEMKEHKEQCDSKSSPCNYCGKYFTNKNIHFHEQNCSYRPQFQEEVYYCPICIDIGDTQEYMEEEYYLHVKGAHKTKLNDYINCPICFIKLGTSTVVPDFFRHTERHEINYIRSQSFRERRRN
eukprot:TRINITY_DN4173_c0_g2_i1.p1 TRINITY_DN4173_c0_g2~~TRINITY_DN4173_c0_g2_i1.p1  ORF type:complete len:510 (+),score=98.13 TRINITY_DN4173_c0_g2_i1:376-1905(+)